MADNNLTPDFSDDTLSSSTLSGDEDIMTAKFFNFQCIILYAYIDYGAAQNLTDKNIINTPLTLYESPYMAQQFTSTSSRKQLIAFAVWVQDNVYDELDLELDSKIKKSLKTKERIQKELHVIRKLDKFKPDGKQAKPYIKYIIQNANAIKQVFPL